MGGFKAPELAATGIPLKFTQLAIASADNTVPFSVHPSKTETKSKRAVKIQGNFIGAILPGTFNLDYNACQKNAQGLKNVGGGLH